MRSTNTGIFIALTLIGLWGISLSALLTLELSRIPVAGVPLCLLYQTFLYTGLFITAHDALHGSVCPPHPRTNNWIGALAVGLYALFSYDKLREKHWAHHRTPASDADPDFHDGVHTGFFLWYLRFMREYLSWKQLIGMAIVFQVLESVFGIPTLNLLLFWVSPALLSTFQLFYFGTYRPHRTPPAGYNNPHRTQSNAYTPFWSFLTCYHFGYHWEHHEYPYVPWWQLPSVRSERGTRE